MGTGTGTDTKAVADGGPLTLTRPTAAPVCGVLILALGVGALAPHALHAQSGPTAGVVLGATSSRQLWTPEFETSRRTGILAGAYIEAPLPTGALSIVAEAHYVQRGGFVVAISGDDGRPLDGETRSDYLSFPIHLKVGLSIGPARLHVSAGPTIEHLWKTRTDDVVGQILRDEVETVFAVGAGGGVTVRLPNGYLIAVEGRLTEGLGNAYTGSFLSVKNRSRELVVRVGRTIGS